MSLSNMMSIGPAVPGKMIFFKNLSKNMKKFIENRQIVFSSKIWMNIRIDHPRNVTVKFDAIRTGGLIIGDFQKYFWQNMKKIHKKLKNRFFSTIWTNLRRTLPRSVPAKYGVNRTSGFREEDFKLKFPKNMEKKS